MSHHEAFSRTNLPKILVFYLKLILEEPFRAYEKIRYTRKIKEHKLQKDPIFIIGHWRSGTSFLQYLLGRDPQFGYLNKFQAVFPDVFLGSEQLLKSIDYLVPESLSLIQDAQNMSIDLDLDSPSEIEIALTTMISPASLHWGHIFPQNAWKYFDKFLFFDTASKADIETWMRDYHHLIKKTSLKNSGQQLLIKSPGNTSRTNKLLEMYSDAKFIFIHRNPYDVFYSNKKLWNTLLNNLGLQNFEDHQIEEEIINVYKKLMSRYTERHSDIPDSQLAEIRFENFVAEPVQELQKVYNKLELTGFKSAKPHFNQFLAQKTEGKSSSYQYEDHIIEKINKNWEFAFEQWNYSILETKKQNKERVFTGTS